MKPPKMKRKMCYTSERLQLKMKDGTPVKQKMKVVFLMTAHLLPLTVSFSLLRETTIIQQFTQ